MRTVLLVLTAAALASSAYSQSERKPDKRKSEAALQRGQKAMEAGRRQEAIADFSEALQSDPGNLTALRARARLYWAAGDAAKARADFDEAVRIQPGNAQLYAARAEFF